MFVRTANKAGKCRVRRTISLHFQNASCRRGRPGGQVVLCSSDSHILTQKGLLRRGFQPSYSQQCISKSILLRMEDPIQMVRKPLHQGTDRQNKECEQTIASAARFIGRSGPIVKRLVYRMNLTPRTTNRPFSIFFELKIHALPKVDAD